MKALYGPCEICGHSQWEIQYQGRIREGGFGNLSPETCYVARCSNCGIERLNEKACKDEEFYEKGIYKNLINEAEEESSSRAKRNLDYVQDLILGERAGQESFVIGEIGCAGGHFLSQVEGLGKEVVAVEPSMLYHAKLAQRGYRVYSMSENALEDYARKIGLIFCFAVIEHTQDPLKFLQEIKGLLAPGGSLILSTPNRRDILMEIGLEGYRQFFYRCVHRWYFDRESFSFCARKAGLQVVEVKSIHRFGLSNAMAWLKDGRPTGAAALPHLDSPDLDRYWKEYLSSRGVGDFLFFKMKSEQGSL
ncbi:MAG: hypothetical protein CVU64_17935 [Deltaproteobacteria bacterium HGW-Deltaproteobacteria-21]|nr:MAG: hypothetical protein CVU64_17935 [Deltaproteobacteria bacterium HGW-Deltaproteobacteria-21]